MRPVHILLLILAGAIGGAVIMKFVPRPPAAVSAPTVAQVQPPAPQPPVVETPAAPAQQVPVQEPLKPSPIPARREAPKPLRFYHKPPARVIVTVVPRPLPAIAPATPAAPKDVPTPSTSGPTISPPPVRTEPENATPGSPEGPVAPAPPPRQVTLNAGLLIPVRLVDGLSSERNAPGDAFAATLDRELVVDDLVIAERGARVEGRVVAVDAGGKARGAATLAVELTRIYTSDGQAVPVQTEAFEKRAPTTHGEDAAKVAGGAAIGAVIGALAGGGKGAAIGAGVGGGAGAGDVLLTRGKPASLPTETQIMFCVKTPVTVTERR